MRSPSVHQTKARPICIASILALCSLSVIKAAESKERIAFHKDLIIQGTNCQVRLVSYPFTRVTQVDDKATTNHGDILELKVSPFAEGGEKVVWRDYISDWAMIPWSGVEWVGDLLPFENTNILVLVYAGKTHSGFSCKSISMSAEPQKVPDSLVKFTKEDIRQGILAGLTNHPTGRIKRPSTFPFRNLTSMSLHSEPEGFCVSVEAADKCMTKMHYNFSSEKWIAETATNSVPTSGPASKQK